MARISCHRSCTSLLTNLFGLLAAIRIYEPPSPQIFSTEVNVPDTILVDINFWRETAKKPPFETKGCNKQAIQPKYLLSIPKSASLIWVSRSIHSVTTRARCSSRSFVRLYPIQLMSLSTLSIMFKNLEVSSKRHPTLPILLQLRLPPLLLRLLGLLDGRGSRTHGYRWLRRSIRNLANVPCIVHPSVVFAADFARKVKLLIANGSRVLFSVASPRVARCNRRHAVAHRPPDSAVRGTGSRVVGKAVFWRHCRSM